MFALVRKNLASLITDHTSSVRKVDVPYSPSLHFFSTWRERQVDTSDKVYDVLVHKHHFSPEVASLAASRLTEFRSPLKADLILSFLQECGFSSIQLEKIVKYKPRILSHSVEDIKFKIKIFQDLGLSSEDIAKLVSSNQSILHLSAKSNIIPSLSLLKDLLGSDYDVARVIRRSTFCLTSDLKATLLPNVDLLKSCGIRMERICWLLYRYQRCVLIKPDVMRKTIDKAKEMGFNPSSNMFIHAVRCISTKREGTWEVKSQAFRNLGFSDNDMVTMFRKAPNVFDISMNKVEKAKELMLATGKFSISSIVDYPTSLLFSVENRLKPRLQILGILESKNLIKNWPSLGTFLVLTDVKFFEQFIRPYSDELPEVTVLQQG